MALPFRINDVVSLRTLFPIYLLSKLLKIAKKLLTDFQTFDMLGQFSWKVNA